MQIKNCCHFRKLWVLRKRRRDWLQLCSCLQKCLILEAESPCSVVVLWIIPIIYRLLGPGAAAAGARIAGGRLVAGGAAVVLVSLIAWGQLWILHVLHRPAAKKTQEPLKRWEKTTTASNRHVGQEAFLHYWVQKIFKQQQRVGAVDSISWELCFWAAWGCMSTKKVTHPAALKPFTNGNIIILKMCQTST